MTLRELREAVMCDLPGYRLYGMEDYEDDEEVDYSSFRVIALNNSSMGPKVASFYKSKATIMQG